MPRARTFLTMVGIGFVLLVGGIPSARAGVDAQACCRGASPCLDLTPEDCAAQNGYSLGTGTTCAADADRCVPAAGAWGLTVMALLLLTAATLVMRARRSSLPNLRTVVVLLALAAPAASTAFAAPPAAKVENVHSVTDGQRTIRIIAAPIRVASGKPTLTERVLGRRPLPIDGGVAQALPAADQPDANADDAVWPTSFGGGGDDDRGHNTARISSTPPGPKDLGHPTNAEDDASDAGEGGVAATTVGGQIQVLGMELRYGPTGPAVPIRLDSKLQSDPDFVPRFGGSDLKAYNANNPPNCSQNTPSTCDGIETVALGGGTGLLVFRARAAFDPDNADHDNNPWTGADFHREVLSDSANSLVLIDGDNINALITQKGIHPPYGSQVPIKDIIAPYIDSAGNVYLDPNRILILFELGTTNTSSAAYDFQDLVIALDLEGVVQAPDYYLPNPSDQATGSPDSTWPTDTFDGSIVRAAPGASRLRGIAYLRSPFTALQVGTYLINACITQDWSTCNPTTLVYSKPFQNDTVDMADMALTDPAHGLDAIGWIERTSSNRVTYKVAFSQNNGASWLAPITLGSYTASGSAPNDIDLAANDDGDIGILTYYRQESGANPTDPDSLVLYIYDPSLTQVRKTIATAAAPAKFASGCESYCFGLTGDSNDTFHAFYYVGSNPSIQARVSTVIASAGGSVTPRPIPVNLTFVPAVGAARTSMGAAFVRWASGNNGLYDVPTNAGGTISLRTSSFTLNGDPDDSEYSQTVRIVNAAQGEAPSGSMYSEKINANGVDVINSPINDIQAYPFCAFNQPKVNNSDWCYRYQVRDLNGLGGTVIGNVYYSSSMLTILHWEPLLVPPHYQADHQNIVIHQTIAEP